MYTVNSTSIFGDSHHILNTMHITDYLEDISVLYFVLHCVVVCHYSTHDGVPVKRQYFVILLSVSYLQHLRPLQS